MAVGDAPVITSKLERVLRWARQSSLFQYPFVTACCGVELMATSTARYDIGRFGAEIPRFSPRQSDLLLVVGTITHKISPHLCRTWDEMLSPKWSIAFGACASTGGFYDNYATVQGASAVIPVDVFVPGCPPRPEMFLDGLLALQDRIGRGISAEEA